MKRCCGIVLLMSALLVACGGIETYDPPLEGAKGDGASTVLSRAQVRSILADQELSARQIDGVIATLDGVSDRTAPLMIKGALTTRGFNGAFFVDNDHWAFDASFVDPGSGQVVKVPDLFDGHYFNGGLKVGLEYKWVLVFLTGDVSVQNLDGAEFGRGVGITLEATIGIDLQYLPGENRAGDAIIVAPAIGFAGGVQFPKITFTKKPLI